MYEFVEYVKLALSFLILGYASWSDWRTREVSNLVWAVYAPLGLGLTGYQLLLLQSWPRILTVGLGVGVVFGVAYVFFLVGLMGGADVKALACLAVTLPWPPLPGAPLLGLFAPLFPVSFLTNSFLLPLFTIPYTALRNLQWRLRWGGLFQGFEHEPLPKRLLTLMVAFKAKRSALSGGPHYSLAEETRDVGGTPRRFIRLSPRADEAQPNLDGLPSEVWVTLRLPMLIFITGGVVVAVFLGDIVLWLLSVAL